MHADLLFLYIWQGSRSLSRLVNLYTISHSRHEGEGYELPAGDLTSEKPRQRKLQHRSTRTTLSMLRPLASAATGLFRFGGAGFTYFLVSGTRAWAKVMCPLAVLQEMPRRADAENSVSASEKFVGLPADSQSSDVHSTYSSFSLTDSQGVSSDPIMEKQVSPRARYHVSEIDSLKAIATPSASYPLKAFLISAMPTYRTPATSAPGSRERTEVGVLCNAKFPIISDIEKPQRKKMQETHLMMCVNVNRLGMIER